MTPIDKHPIIIDMIVLTIGGFSLKTHKSTKKFSVVCFRRTVFLRQAPLSAQRGVSINQYSP
jgi:hypothetical protein